MIHELGIELGSALAAQGCPLKVVDGPEPTRSTTFARERIVIEHDDGDAFAPVRSQHRNPKLRMVRNVAAKVTIYAQSPASGATDWEHRRRAEHVLDLVLVGLEKVILARKNGWVLKSGRFLVPADLQKSETAGGAAYELSFTVERGVFEKKWSGAVRAQVSNIPITSTDEITLANGPENQTPETAC